MDSILETIKVMLGISIGDGEDLPPDTTFDTDVIVGINSAIMSLTQVGIGPVEGFSITGTTETWDDFLSGKTNVEGVKTFVYLQTRLVFDPPQNSFTIDAMKKVADETLWRLNVIAEGGNNA